MIKDPVRSLAFSLATHSSNKRTVFFVEGSSDKKFYARIFDGYKVEFIITKNKLDSPDNCKLSVIENTQYVRKENSLNNVYGIVDADFDHVKSCSISYPNGIFHTDFSDILVDAAFYGKFENYLKQVIEVEKINNIYDSFEEVKSSMLNAGGILGIVRYINNDCLDISFPKNYKLKDSKNINVEKLLINCSKVLVDVLSANNRMADFDKKKAYFQDMLEENEDKILFCNGHDFAEIFRVFLNKFQKNDRTGKTRQDCEDLLLSHYGPDEFRLSKLCAEITSVI